MSVAQGSVIGSEVRIVKNESLIGETKNYKFYSNYWMNLHHFLYQQAKRNQLKNIIEIGDTDAILSLKEEELEIFEDAVLYYRTYIIQYHLLFHLGSLRVWLQDLEIGVVKENPFEEELPEYDKLLNDFSKVYSKYFWESHNQRNIDTFSKHEQLLTSIESDAIARISKLAKVKWVDGKVRVDLSPYANGLGGYTPKSPRFNIFISTSDITTDGNNFIEIIFHESAHLIFGREDPVREIIFNKSEELGIEFPENLWHAVLFYFTGTVIQQEFLERGITHNKYMDQFNVFGRFNSENFKNTLSRYMNGEITWNKTVDELLSEFE